MNFKRYHESKNLLSEKYENRSINGVGAFTIDNNYDLWIGEVIAGQTYAISNMNYVYGFFTAKPLPNTGATYDGSRGYEISGTAVVTIPSGCTWIAVRVLHNADNAMCNTGSTPLPYEPYSSEVWHDTPHYIHNTSTDTITTLPADIYADGTDATVDLKGNMSQASGVSPTTPIQPSECGDRTGNLLDKTAFTTIDATIEQIKDGIRITTQSNGYAARIILDVLQNTDYRISYIWKNISGSSTNTVRVFAGTGSSTQIAMFEYLNGGTFNTGNNTKINIWFYASFSAAAIVEYTNIMFNTGSTPLPYEPYGVKIPISSANTTTPVYLGEVQTTRKIRKLVLDGTENWNEGTSNYYIFIDVSGRGGGIPNSTVLSTHTESGVVINNNGTALFFKKSVFVHSSLADFKTYLAQQHTNGTPVTVWYVLATPTTGIVNEPLRKIGDYADEVSGITIPTIAGANTLSIGTTLQPSEVTVNYKGWHPVQSVHEAENGQWD